MTAEPRRITDPEVLKGLTHPLRRRIYRLLAEFGPAMVTTLAERTGAETGQLSYHLRELSRRGFIESAPELARDKRERWWRSVPGPIAWSTSEVEGPDGAAVAEALHGMLVDDEFTRLRAYEMHRDSWSKEWLSAVTTSNSHLRLNPAELAQLAAEMDAVIRRWVDAGHGTSQTLSDPEDGRESVFLFFHAFPERP